jgi:glutaconate CoA-transferase subunit B
VAGGAVIDFLVRAAREFHSGYVFTGFHWPVLAARVAQLLARDVRLVYEGGAVTRGPAAALPTSTTDYPAYANTITWRGGFADTLLALPGRYDRVVLDAANVDLRGRVNSSLIGPTAAPRVRLPGGGGAPDVAARARELVLLHGGADPTRLVRAVEHVTAAPAPGTPVRLHTRWGMLALGASPSLLTVADDSEDFLAHLGALGVRVDEAVPVLPPTLAECSAARTVFAEASRRGYRVAAPDTTHR